VHPSSSLALSPLFSKIAPLLLSQLFRIPAEITVLTRGSNLGTLAIRAAISFSVSFTLILQLGISISMISRLSVPQSAPARRFRRNVPDAGAAGTTGEPSVGNHATESIRPMPPSNDVGQHFLIPARLSAFVADNDDITRFYFPFIIAGVTSSSELKTLAGPLNSTYSRALPRLSPPPLPALYCRIKLPARQFVIRVGLCMDDVTVDYLRAGNIFPNCFSGHGH